MKKIVVAVLVVLLAVCCFALVACDGLTAEGGGGMDGADGLNGTDGKNGINGANGADGADAVTLTVDELFNKWLEDHPGATFDDFLDAYLDVNTDGLTSASTKALRSTVKITADANAGSGVIYQLNASEESAVIITNHHVVYNSSTGNPAADVGVYLYGKELAVDKIPATVYGSSAEHDLAVVVAHSVFFSDEMSGYYTQAEIYDSNNLVTGQTVLAVGNPDNRGFAVTSGIVSLVSEQITIDGGMYRAIRTDAAINAGNSGGGLYDGDGRLVGVVSAKTVKTEIENMGYAIPVTLAVSVAENILDNGGTFNKLLLGVSTNVSASRAEYDIYGNLYTAEEIKIVTVEPGKKGAAAGLAAGDTVTRAKITRGGDTVDELAITRYFHLTEFMLKVRAGDTLTLTINRGGVSQTVTVGY